MTEFNTDTQPTVTELISGIVGDAQDLIKQQFSLFKREVHEDFRKTKDGIQSLVLGGVVLSLGGILLCLTTVHLVRWAFAWPLWSCYALVGGSFAIVGGLLLIVGIRRLKSINPLPDETVATMKENVQWIANPK